MTTEDLCFCQCGGLCDLRNPAGTKVTRKHARREACSGPTLVNTYLLRTWTWWALTNGDRKEILKHTLDGTLDFWVRIGHPKVSILSGELGEKQNKLISNPSLTEEGNSWESSLSWLWLLEERYKEKISHEHLHHKPTVLHIRQELIPLDDPKYTA